MTIVEHGSFLEGLHLVFDFDLLIDLVIGIENESEKRVVTSIVEIERVVQLELVVLGALR